jgi:hypothetical protein
VKSVCPLVLKPDADQVPSPLKVPLANRVDVDPLLLNPPAVNRRPGGQAAVVAVPSCPVESHVEAQVWASRGRLLRTQ